MLKVDLRRSSDEELAALVAARCVPFGTVTKVTVYAARAGSPARPFAIVAMATREAAESVSARLGGRTVGSAVVIFLEQPSDAAAPPVKGGVADNVVKIGQIGNERAL